MALLVQGLIQAWFQPIGRLGTIWGRAVESLKMSRPPSLLDRIPRCTVEFERLFLHYRGQVHAQALRLLQNHDDAQDVVQIVFSKAWTSPESFRGGNVAGWLATLAKNASIDVLRKRTRERAFSQAMLYADGNSTDTAEIALGNLELARVRDALDQLNQRSRLLIVASLIACQPHRSIARSHAMPLGTVKTRIRSGVAHLRRLLAAS